MQHPLRILGIADFYAKDSFDVIEFAKEIGELLSIEASGETTSPTRKSPSNSTLVFNIELEKHKRELITQINNCRKEADDILLAVESQDIVNSYKCSSYFDGVSRHREHFASKHAKKLVSSRILNGFY